MEAAIVEPICCDLLCIGGAAGVATVPLLVLAATGDSVATALAAAASGAASNDVNLEQQRQKTINSNKQMNKSILRKIH